MSLQYHQDSELPFKVLVLRLISYSNDETTGYATLDRATHDLRNALPLDTTRFGSAPAIISPVAR
jgi:hypothetical protein